MPTDIGEGAEDIDATAVEIDVPDRQGGGLAPAQAGVGQEQDKQRPAARLAGQREDLGVSKVDVIASLRRGSPRPRGDSIGCARFARRDQARQTSAA